MKNKALVCCLIITLILNISTINAQEINVANDNNQYEVFDPDSILTMKDLVVSDNNSISNQYISKKSSRFTELSDKKSTKYSIKDNTIKTMSLDTVTDNSDPNNAIEIQCDKENIGIITADSTQKWYSFTATGSAIVTADLYMESSSNFDLYIYKLNAENSTLELVGGSVEASLGTPELAKLSVDTGSYYILVNSVEGTGVFSMKYYLGTNDSKEINDTLDSASSYERNSKMLATIDSPYDYDIYKFTVTTNQIIEYAFERPTGYDYEIQIYDGSNFYNIADSASYRLNSGTYYFVVKSNSETGLYSNTAPYTLKVLDYKMTSDTSATYWWRTADMKAIFQFNKDRTAYYVNGNPINFTYARTYTVSGGKKVYINLRKKADQMVVLQYSEMFVRLDNGDTYDIGEVPDFINYSGPFTGDKSYSNALMLSIGFTDLSVSSYSSQYQSINSSRAMVVIDSDTGNVVDILEPNPIYDGVYVRWSRIPGTACSYDYTK